MSQTTSPVCIVTGVGAGTGAAVCRRFAREGYRVAMLARSIENLAEFEAEIPGTVAFPTDVTDEVALRTTLRRILRELGPARVLVHNAGNASFGDLMNVDSDKFEQAWRINTLALFVCGQEVAPDMIAAGGGTILVTGATASLRGGAAFAAFASAKAGQRALAQSMARLLGPKGVHVAYVIIDGVIDMPRTREFMANAPKESFLAPDAIAETYWHLASQDRSAWTFELDVRPFGEKW
jgi:NAD(P)-dependent dehydrogenase (short-subunit alcohol dehydrogenase family)